MLNELIVLVGSHKLSLFASRNVIFLLLLCTLNRLNTFVEQWGLICASFLVALRMLEPCFIVISQVDHECH